MKVLVTGADGMLGSKVCGVLAQSHEVIPTDLHSKENPMDITNAAALFALVRKFLPDVIVHCAAMTDVDECTRDPQTAVLVNGVGTGNLATIAFLLGITVLYISTDYVFDGKSGDAYKEQDDTNPINAYGETKLLGESLVQKLVENYYIVRTSWLFSETHKCFPLSILNAAKAGKELKVVDDQFGSPTYADDLAVFISELIESKAYGIYHFTNSGSCSWYEFAKKLLELANMPDAKISPIGSAEWGSPTERPKYSVLRNYRREFMCKEPNRTWQEAAEEFVRKWITAKP